MWVSAGVGKLWLSVMHKFKYSLLHFETLMSNSIIGLRKIQQKYLCSFCWTVIPLNKLLVFEDSSTCLLLSKMGVMRLGSDDQSSFTLVASLVLYLSISLISTSLFNLGIRDTSSTCKSKIVFRICLNYLHAHLYWVLLKLFYVVFGCQIFAFFA